MTVDEVLSIGFDTLDDKYVRIFTRILCTYYYLDDRSNITHKMINNKDILPLYKAMIDYRKLYDSDRYLTMRIIHVYLLAILCYSILRSRFKNRECSIYREITSYSSIARLSTLKVSSGNISVYMSVTTSRTIKPWTKICSEDEYMYVPDMTKNIATINRRLNKEILNPGSDVRKILRECTKGMTETDRELLTMMVYLYKVDELYKKVLPQILCVDGRSSTHFSGIPDLSMFR
jgi:hypothetical protein